MKKHFMIIAFSASLAACSAGNFLDLTSEARLNGLFIEGFAKHNQVHRTNCKFTRYNPPTEKKAHSFSYKTKRNCWMEDTSIIWNTVQCALNTGTYFIDCLETDYPNLDNYAYAPRAPDVNVILEEPRNRGPVICNTIGSSTICNQH